MLYRFKHPWRDGSTHVLLEALEVVEKLAALVPPPRFNLVRYLIPDTMAAAIGDVGRDGVDPVQGIELTNSRAGAGIGRCRDLQ